jgi:hypothetical protein
MYGTQEKSKEILLYGVMLLSLLGASLISFICLKETAFEHQRNSKQNIALKDHLGQRRSYFFGHKEISDLMTGLNIISVSVDAFRQPLDADSRENVAARRFEDAMKDVEFLSKVSLGMVEVYSFPATHLLFDNEEPLRALKIVRLGMKDIHADARILMLGGFISLFFLRDVPQASEFFSTLIQKEGSPPWLIQLSTRLKAGKDPFREDPESEKILKKVMEKSFPRAKQFFERNKETQELSP